MEIFITGNGNFTLMELGNQSQQFFSGESCDTGFFHHSSHGSGQTQFQVCRRQRQLIVFCFDKNVCQNGQSSSASDDVTYFLKSFQKCLFLDFDLHVFTCCLQKFRCIMFYFFLNTGFILMNIPVHNVYNFLIQPQKLFFNLVYKMF